MTKLQILAIAILLPLQAFADQSNWHFAKVTPITTGQSYAWRGYKDVNTPTEENLRQFVQFFYQNMKEDCVKQFRRDQQSKCPSAMSAAFYRKDGEPLARRIYLHSSIKGSPKGTQNDEKFMNSCSFGEHRADGMCAEFANMAYASREGYKLEGSIFAVYGLPSIDVTQPEFMEPCSYENKQAGCRQYANWVGANCVNPPNPTTSTTTTTPAANNKNDKANKREALAEPEAEPVPEAKKPKPRKSPKSGKSSKVVSSQTQAVKPGKSTKMAHSTPKPTKSSHATTKSAHSTVTTDDASPTSGADSCPLFSNTDPKDTVSVDESKLPKVGKVKLVSETDIAGKNKNKPSGTDDGTSTRKTATKTATRKTHPPGWKTVQFPRRHLLAAFGF